MDESNERDFMEIDEVDMYPLLVVSVSLYSGFFVVGTTVRLE